MKNKKQINYVKQQNAHLSPKDSILFYKIYFALLDFTNKKYKINPKLKINYIRGVNPADLNGIIEKFWANKDTIVLEFCLANPKKFTKEELKITEDFKKGIRDIFVIMEYHQEYTALMNEDKVYMVKGLNDNIDSILPYKQLPYIAKTTIIPFKNSIIYDGLLLTPGVKFGTSFYKNLEKDYSKSIKYYHL